MNKPNDDRGGSTPDNSTAEKVLTEISKGSAAGNKVAAKKEIGGPKGLEPTRYGDWEAKGRCYDF